MKKLILLSFFLSFAIGVANAEFGGSPFSSDRFGISEFGEGYFGEKEAVPSVPTGEQIIFAGEDVVFAGENVVS